MFKIYNIIAILSLLFVQVNAISQNEGLTCATAVELDPNGGACSTLALHSSTWDPTGYGNPESISPSCWANTNNVLWATFTPLTTGTYDITDYCYTGGSKDVAIAVFTGSCGSLTQVDCDRSGSSMGCPVSSISMSMNAGTPYFIAYSPQDGTGTTGICLQGGTSPSPPPNDNCSNAIVLSDDIGIAGTGANATDDGDVGAPPALCSGSIENNIWYEYTATNTQDFFLQVRAANCSQDAGFQVSVYQSTVTCANTTGACVAFSNSATNDDFQTVVSLVSGQTYLINIDGQAGIQCDFIIEMSTIDDLVCAATAVIDNNPVCNGGSDGQAVANGTSGNLPYTFLWSNGQTTAVATGLSATTYAVTVTDNSACAASTTITLINPTVISVTNSSSDVSCNGGNDGSINITAVGGGTSYTYLWSNSATTEDVSGLNMSSYTVTVTDNFDCDVSSIISISEPSALTITSNSTSVTCNGGNDGTANITITGGSSGYTFLWSNSATIKDISSLTQGTYDVTILDGTCSITATEIITEPSALTISSNSTSVTCNGGNNGTVNITVTGGSSSYSYLWSNSATTQNISGLSAATYNVTVMDGTCSITASETIAEPSLLTILTTVTSASCGSDNGIIDASTSGGSGTSYSYVWSNSETTIGISGLASGNYSLTVTNNLGCFNTITESVSGSNHSITVTSVSDVSCNNGSDGVANVAASGGATPYTYLWSNGETSTNAVALSAGIQYVTVEDATTCKAIEEISISEPAAIVTAVTTTNVECFGESNGALDLSVSGGTSPYTYSWSNGETTRDISGLVASSYSVYVVDANNCDINGVQMVTNCFEIQEIRANACGGDEEDNEMIRIQIGPLAVTTSDIAVDWPNGAWDGACQTAATALTVANINGTILGGGQLIEPGATIPPYSQVIIVTSVLFDWSAHNWSTLDYNLYIIFQCGDQGSASFINYTSGDVTPRTTTVDIGVGCSDVVSYIPDDLPNGGDGDGATFDFAGNATYENNGCNAPTVIPSVPLTIEITQPSALTLTEATTNDVLCNGESNGSATVLATGGTTNYSYSWANGQLISNATGLASGVQVATVTDANNCTATTSITINEPTLLIGSIACVSVTTNGGSDGSVSGTASGGVTPYVYAWDISVQTTSPVTGLTAQVVNATISDANGCSVTDICTITEPTCNLTLSLNTTPTSCNGLNDGIVEATATGGVTNYSYVWSSSANTTNLETGLLAGTTYSVTATDAINCTVTDNFTITEPVAITATILVTQEPLCTSSSDGIAAVNTVGGISPYTFTWNTTPNQTTATVTGLPQGSYLVTVYDVNNCNVVEGVTLTAPSPVNSTITVTDVDCNGLSAGSVTISTSGGTTPYSYSWNGGTTINTISGLAANNYDVTTTDGNACTYVATYTISEPLAITLSTTATQAACGGSDGSATVMASGGTTNYTYLWNAASQTTQTATGLFFGNYPVTVTDGNGCNEVTNALVNNPSPTLTVTAVTSVTCNGESDGATTVTASGGNTPYTFSWNNPASPNATGTLTGLSGGINNITVNDASSCFTSVDVFIDEPDAITITSNVTDLTCFGMSDGAIDITTTGGATPYTYSWSTGATTQSISGLIPDVYDLELTDNNSCISGSSSPAAISTITGCIQIRSILVDACHPDGALEGLDEMVFFQTGNSSLDAANLSVAWPTANLWRGVCTNPAWITNVSASIVGGGSVSEPAGGIIPPNSTVLLVTNIKLTDTYNLLQNLTQDIYVIFQCFEPSSPNSNDGGHFGNYTTDGSLNDLIMDFGGGCSDQVSYIKNLLIKQDGSSGKENGAAVNYLEDGTATYVNDGCIAPFGSITTTQGTASFTFTVTEPIELSVTLTSNDISCNGLSDGEGIATASGGTSGYSYLWSNGETNASASALISGVNEITVTDANSCSITESVTITEPSVLSVTGSSTDISCFGLSDGEGVATVLGGTSPYNYLWNDASLQSTNIATGLSSGVFEVTVTDNNACFVVEEVTITEPSEITITDIINNLSCFQSSDGEITLSVTGGMSSYNYLWNNGFSVNSNLSLNSGSYNITISDSNGCMDYYETTLTEPANISTTFNSTNENCGDADGTASITVTGGGSTNYTYQWTNNSTSSSISGIVAGKHYITISDGIGCNYLDSTVVGAFGILDVLSTATPISCNGDNDGTIALTPQSGSTPYTYIWSNAATTSSISNLSQNTFIATVTDGTGCMTIISETITEPSALILSITATEPVCSGNNDGTATVNVTGGSVPYTYQWNDAGNQNTAMALGLTSGSYSVTITDNNSCKSVDAVIISEPTAITATATMVSDATCYGSSTGEGVISVSGGNVPYSYLWSNGLSTSSSSALIAGIYNLTVSDNNDCFQLMSITIGEPAELFIGNVSTTNASCEGLTDGTVLVTITGGNSPYSYNWSNNSTDTTLTAVASGIYGVTVSDNLGCSIDSAGIVVNAYEAIADFSWAAEELIAPSEVVFTNLSSGADYYVWDFGTGLNSDGENPTYIFEEAGTYEVLLTAYVDSNKLCNDTTKRIIIIDQIPSYSIAAVFSPNGDNQNDIFTINGINIEEVNGKIFNRWGIELFGWETIQGGWDGRTYAGEEVPEGTYFYLIVIKISETDAPKEFTGTVTLVR